MDWTLEDNMVDGLFFCATLTGRRGGHTPFVQAGAEASDTGAETVKSDPGFSWEGRSGWVGACFGDKNAESCGVVLPLRIPFERPQKFFQGGRATSTFFLYVKRKFMTSYHVRMHRVVFYVLNKLRKLMTRT